MSSIHFKSVRAKILAAFLVTAVGMVGASGFTLMKLRDTYRLVQQAKTRQLAPTQHGRGMLANIYAYNQAQMVLSQYLLMPNGMSVAKVGHEHATDMQDRARANADLLAGDDLPAAARPAVFQLLNQFAVADASAREFLAMPLDQLAGVVAAAAKNPALAASSLKTRDELIAAGEAAVVALDQAASADRAKAHTLYDNSLRAAVLVLAGCVLLALGIGLVLARSIRGPLKQSVRVLEGVAEGDLTRRLEVHGADEVGQMALTLNRTLGTVHDVIEQLESDASRLAELAERGKSGAGVSRDDSQELAAMAGNLSAMISIFQTERNKS
jgi:methyl-accepting chemotaxis protein